MGKAEDRRYDWRHARSGEVVMTPEISAIVSITATIISVAGFVFAVWSWSESNRPVVVAYIRTEAQGNVASMISLVVENVGNRPAINVSLSCSQADFLRARGDRPVDVLDEPCWRCFTPRAMIPILKPGERRFNAFGALRADRASTWVPEMRLPITIRYGEYGWRRRHTVSSHLLLMGGEAFAGSIWT